MPNRILNQKINTSNSISKLSAFEEMVFVHLIVSCDDFGRFYGNPQIVKGMLFPLRDWKTEEIEKALRKLEAEKMIVRYEADGSVYLEMTAWMKYQTPRAKESKYPAPEDGTEIIRKEPEPEPKRQVAQFVPPTIEQVAEYCKERQNGIDAEEFVSYYQSVHWLIGNKRMQDWKAAVITWEKRNKKNGQQKKVSAQNYTQRSYSGQEESCEEMLERLKV